MMERIHNEQLPGLAVLQLEREYGSSEFSKLAELKCQLFSIIDDFPLGIVLDLIKTRTIGCGFLNVLLEAYAQAGKCNCWFALCTLQPIPRSVLKVTRLDSLWQIFEARQEAIEAMQTKAPV